MACKYLTGLKIARCLATYQLMIPSLLELAVFCNADHESCPIYREKEYAASMKKPIQISGIPETTEQKDAKAG